MSVSRHLQYSNEKVHMPTENKAWRGEVINVRIISECLEKVNMDKGRNCSKIL